MKYLRSVELIVGYVIILVTFVVSSYSLISILKSNYIAEYKLAIGLPLSIVVAASLLSLSLLIKHRVQK